MLQIKGRKQKYRNTNKKLKAAFRGRGFQFDSKIYEKPLNLIMKIIRQNKKCRTYFLARAKTSERKLWRETI